MQSTDFSMHGNNICFPTISAKVCGNTKYNTSETWLQCGCSWGSFVVGASRARPARAWLVPPGPGLPPGELAHTHFLCATSMRYLCAIMRDYA